MKPRILSACALLFTLAALSVPASSRQRSDAFDASIKPFLRTYCYGCHSGAQPAAGFDLTSYATENSVVSDQRRWNLVLARLRLRDDFSFEKLPISKAPPPFCVPKLF